MQLDAEEEKAGMLKKMMGGDEKKMSAHDFIPAYQIATEAGLSCSIHAGEMLGAESVRDALRYLPIKRIGHGVRAAEDFNVVQEIIEKNISLEVCLSSNIALGVYPSYKEHSLPILLESGVNITLNTDDPPYFRTTIAHEYALAAKHYHLSAEDLMQISRQAIRASFVDDDTKMKLMSRLIL